MSASTAQQQPRAHARWGGKCAQSGRLVYSRATDVMAGFDCRTLGAECQVRVATGFNVPRRNHYTQAASGAGLACTLAGLRSALLPLPRAHDIHS